MFCFTFWFDLPRKSVRWWSMHFLLFNGPDVDVSIFSSMSFKYMMWSQRENAENTDTHTYLTILHLWYENRLKVFYFRKKHLVCIITIHHTYFPLHKKAKQTRCLVSSISSVFISFISSQKNINFIIIAFYTHTCYIFWLA